MISEEDEQDERRFKNFVDAYVLKAVAVERARLIEEVKKLPYEVKKVEQIGIKVSLIIRDDVLTLLTPKEDE